MHLHLIIERRRVIIITEGIMKRAVTIKDIAEQLNLSRNTVAKALNGQYVPEKTRELVLKKAQELNYKSLNARHVDFGAKKYRILIVSGKPLNNISYFVPIVQGIENFCFERNYFLFQHTYDVNRMPFSHFADQVKELDPDGIVAIECFDKSFITRLAGLGKPICFVDFTVYGVSLGQNYDIINTNDVKSVSNIVKMLHNKYKISNFSFVGDPKHCLSFHDRYMGMLEGIVGFKGVHSRKEDIINDEIGFDYGDVETLKNAILKLRYAPECFICSNDFVARSVCKALEGLNIAVPQDALVVGFDNAPESTECAPLITTFSVDKVFLGRETVHTLVHRIESPDIPSRMITIGADCILRNSTDCPTAKL